MFCIAELLFQFLNGFETEVELSDGVKSSAKDTQGESSQSQGAFDSQPDSMDMTGPRTVAIRKYVELVDRVARKQVKAIDVWVEEVESWCFKRRLTVNLSPEEISELVTLPNKIEENTLRYMSLLEEVLDDMVKEATQNYRLSRGLAPEAPEEDGDMDTTNPDPNQPNADKTKEKANMKRVQALLHRK